jgi:transcriptional regulator
MADDLELLRGTLDMLVLKSLIWGPRHGYAVTSWIRETSGDALQVDDGALYGALHRLLARGWLSAEWGLSDNNRKAKYYSLSAAGRRELKAQQAIWRRYTTAVAKVMETA